jgi:hypothetical protein
MLVQSCLVEAPSSVRPINMPTTTEDELLESPTDLSFVRNSFATMSSAGSFEGLSQPFPELSQQRGPVPVPSSAPASTSRYGAVQHHEEPRVLSPQRQLDYAKDSRHNVCPNEDSPLSGEGSAGSLSSNYSSSSASSQEDEAIYQQFVAQQQHHQEQCRSHRLDTLQSIKQRLTTQSQQGISPPFFLTADQTDGDEYGSFVDVAEGDESDRQPVVMYTRPAVKRWMSTSVH